VHSLGRIQSGGGDGLIYLGAWLKSLVALVLLAVFTELLLPTSALHRYLRTVFGLAIIAAMLQPLTPLLHTNWAKDLEHSAGLEFDSGRTSDASPESTASAQANRVQQELQSETATDANDILSRELRAAIVQHFHQAPDFLSVSGLESANPRIQVSELVGVPDQKLAQFVSTWVGISQTAVTVRDSGEGGGRGWTGNRS
jgi:stage III sporulation protein AF